MRIILVLICCFLFTGNICSQDSEADKQLEIAANSYQQGDLHNAERIYSSLSETGYASDEFYHNLGTIYLQQGETAKAILILSRGLKMSPGNRLLKEKLEFARTQIENDVIEVKDFYPLRIWKQISRSAGGKFWFALQVLFAFLFLGTLYKWRMGSGSGQNFKFFVASISSFVVLVLLVALGFSSDNYRYSSENAVVMDSAQLMSGADQRAEVLRDLSPGMMVRIVDSDIKDWVKVSLANKEEGWLLAEVIEEI